MSTVLAIMSASSIGLAYYYLFSGEGNEVKAVFYCLIALWVMLLAIYSKESI